MSAAPPATLRLSGRDNNLNLVRIIAASLVLISHSYVIASGNPHAEPWDAVLGRSPGGLAVDIFFVVSGALVTGSLLRQPSLWPYALARALRIYPGLWVALVLSTALVGWRFTTLPAAAYWADAQTWRYLLGNGLSLIGGQAWLPGGFSEAPFRWVVNGSLWTLRYELRLYLALGLLWWALCRWSPGRAPARLRATMPWLAGGLTLVAVVMLAAGLHSDGVRLGALFCTGSAVWLWRERLVLRGDAFAVALLAMAAAAGVSPLLFEAVYRVAMPYALFWLAYVPAGVLRRYNRMGDYSYGVYVYAFPIQQAVITLWPGLSPTRLSVLAGPLTLACAALSWHLVEHPALGWKDALLARLARRG